MVTSVYGNSYDSVKNIQIDGMLVTWVVETDSTGTDTGGTTGTSSSFPLLMTGVSIQYGRQAIPINTINMGTVGSELIQIMGRPTGQMTVNTVVGAADADISGLLSAAGSTCGEGISLTMKPVGRADKDCIRYGQIYIIHHAFLTSYQSQVQAGQGNINIVDALQFTFTTLDIDKYTSTKTTNNENPAP